MQHPISPVKGRAAANGGATKKWLFLVVFLLSAGIFFAVMVPHQSLFKTATRRSGGGSNSIGLAGGSVGGGDIGALKVQAKLKAAKGFGLSLLKARAEAKDTLLDDVRRLHRAIKLIDDQVESLSDRIEIEDPPPPRSHPPRPTYPLSLTDDDTIFVSVASFRDEECGPMLIDMFEKAAAPQHVYVGVVEQHAATDPPCLPDHWNTCQKDKFCPNDNIRVRRITPKEARGPTFGRYLAMLMYRGQKYFMMIDSHNRFIPKWDFELINLVRHAPSEKAVLSHYPEAWNKGDANIQYERTTTSRLCKARYLENGIIRLDAILGRATEKYYPQPWAAAGFLFADARLIHEVPFDPYLDLVFDGEEILYSVRMWTHGWDIYSPGKNTLFHYYYRAQSKKVWSEIPDWHPRQQKALQRVHYLMDTTKFHSEERLVDPEHPPEHVVKDLDIYGMGHERSLEEWYKFAGVDKNGRSITGDWCIKAALDPRN